MPLSLSSLRTRIALGAIALSLIAACAAWFAAGKWQPDADAYPIQGIDLNERHGEVDWWRVRKSGARFAYLQATEGTTHSDTRFATYWASAAEAGLLRGALHRYSLCSDALMQAEHFVRQVPRSDGQLPPAIDLDVDKGCASQPDRATVVQELRTFITAIERHFGERAILRISSKFEAQYAISSAFPHLLWGERMLLEPTYLARPWTIWQASTMRRIDGVRGAVHWNVMAE